ncbi:putative non-specific serine/threonine protein kinase [Helianthus annuus]|nr:putative non-specific serine/threonine protein kinase [Helianthus annuus]
MLLPYIASIFLLLRICTSLDTIAVNKNIIDGETIVSEKEKFKLGFFSPGSSKHRYLRTVTVVAAPGCRPPSANLVDVISFLLLMTLF